MLPPQKAQCIHQQAMVMIRRVLGNHEMAYVVHLRNVRLKTRCITEHLSWLARTELVGCFPGFSDAEAAPCSSSSRSTLRPFEGWITDGNEANGIF
jgi:hypothetical protein